MISHIGNDSCSSGKTGATHFSLADDWPDFTARFPERDCARWPWWRRHGRPTGCAANVLRHNQRIAEMVGGPERHRMAYCNIGAGSRPALRRNREITVKMAILVPTSAAILSDLPINIDGIRHAPVVDARQIGYRGIPHPSNPVARRQIAITQLSTIRSPQVNLLKRIALGQTLNS